MKTLERDRARILRRDGGCSVKEIARIVGVSRSSVSLWVRAVYGGIQELAGFDRPEWLDL
jgi:transposase